jgi:hypothetical protein
VFVKKIQSGIAGARTAIKRLREQISQLRPRALVPGSVGCGMGGHVAYHGNRRNAFAQRLGSLHWSGIFPLWSGICQDKSRLSGAPMGEIGGTFSLGKTTVFQSNGVIHVFDRKPAGTL